MLRVFVKFPQPVVATYTAKLSELASRLLITSKVSWEAFIAEEIYEEQKIWLGICSKQAESVTMGS